MATIKDGKGTLALAVFDTNAELKKHEFGRPSKCQPHDVSIDIKFCGICHSDLHACNGDWGMDNFPLAPGHEIAGLVQAVGSDVTKFKVGDKVAVGCFVESCGDCTECGKGLQNYCRQQMQTYGTPWNAERYGHEDCVGHTNGGYSSQITVKQDFAYKVPDNIGMEYVGPLLCAGITVFGPLNRHVLGQSEKKNVGVVGFGGLGHMAVKLAVAMGADVTVLSRSTSKKDAAAKLGAKILAHSDEAALKSAAGMFDLIIDTVAFAHDIQPMLPTLKVGGTYCMIGGVVQPVSVVPMTMLFSHLHIEGSLVGGIPETQKMLDFCSAHNILPDIKVIEAKDAGKHFAELGSGTASAVRAVIDMSTLKDL